MLSRTLFLVAAVAAMVCTMTLRANAAPDMNQPLGVKNPSSTYMCGTADCSDTSVINGSCFRRCCKSTGICFSSSCVSTFGRKNDALVNCSNDKKCRAEVACDLAVPTCTDPHCYGTARCLTSACGGFKNGDACLIDGVSKNFKVCGGIAAPCVPRWEYDGTQTCKLKPEYYGTCGTGTFQKGVKCMCGNDVVPNAACETIDIPTLPTETGVYCQDLTSCDSCVPVYGPWSTTCTRNAAGSCVQTRTGRCMNSASPNFVNKCPGWECTLELEQQCTLSPLCTA